MLSQTWVIFQWDIAGIYLSLVVYALRVPFIADLKITFSMVYHARAEGNEFIKAKNTDGDNKEHMFAFVTGLTSQQIGLLLTDLIHRWQDVVHDHGMQNRSCICFTHESLLPPLLFTTHAQTAQSIEFYSVKTGNADFATCQWR